jgi:hypothetical protein
MKPDTWSPLEIEFAQWQAVGLTLPFWWRDDDVVEKTAALGQLSDLAKGVGAQVHLAVIPANLKPGLPDVFVKNKQLIAISHGFSHQSFAKIGQKKCEFPAGRVKDEVVAVLNLGAETLRNGFGDNFAPMFVPPWNRFDLAFLRDLQAVGYKGFSTFSPRGKKWAIDGVEQVNTHVDPIDWHGSRSLVSAEVLVARTVAALKDRRLGIADNTEPFGFLTHHLVHDAEIWAFCEAFLTRFLAGPTIAWNAFEL